MNRRRTARALTLGLLFLPASLIGLRPLGASAPEQVGFVLSEPPAAYVAGAVAVHTLVVSSTSSADETISFRAAGGAWPLELPADFVLPAGGRVSAAVAVSVPFGTADRVLDEVQLGVVPASGGSAVSATLTTRTGGTFSDGAYRGCRYDLNRDGSVNQADVDAVAALFDADRSGPTYERELDFNHDGRIGNADVQTVAGRLGSACRTVPAIDSSALTDAVTVEAVRTHLEAFQAIADANGGNRAALTPGYAASRAYVTDLLAGAGFDVVSATLGIPFFDVITPPTLERVAPGSKTYGEDDFRVFTNSPSGDVTASVQAVDLVLPPGASANTSTSGCESADFAAFVAGRIALLQRGTCTFEEKAANAEAAGAVGVLVFNEGQPNRRDVFSSSVGGGHAIPAFSASFGLGEELAGLLDSGADVQLAMAVETEIGTRTDYSVIADWPGSADERVVLVGGHLDSVTAGPGINDNGSGTATMLETALQMARLGIEPVNRVRFAFWGGEELGLLGSDAYVEALEPAERERILLNLNFDMIGSPNFARFIYDGDGSASPRPGPEGSAEIERLFEAYFEGRGLASEPTAFDGRSDYGPFIAVGIPAGGLFTGAEGTMSAAQAARYGGTAGQRFDPCYHQVCDTIANVSWVVLDEMADALAHSTLTYAMDDTFGYTRATAGAALGADTAPAVGANSSTRNGRGVSTHLTSTSRSASSAAQPAQGETLDVDVVVSDAAALASFEATLLYEGAVLSPTLSAFGPMTPPESGALGPGADVPGRWTFGSYNGAGQSTSGDGLLATVSFAVVGDGDRSVVLAPATTGATDRLGQRIGALLALGGLEQLERLFLPALWSGER